MTGAVEEPRLCGMRTLTDLSDSDLRDHYTAQIPEWLMVCGLTALALFIGAAGTVVVHFVRERL